jgi:HK97 family phage portal protein
LPARSSCSGFPRAGPAAELHLLNPAFIKVEKPASGGLPLAYKYGTGEQAVTYPVNRITGASQVLHVKTFNPLDSWRGLSPLHPSARAVDTHNLGSKWNASLLSNSARPSGVLTMSGSPDETTLNRLREYFKKAWQGALNAGNLPMLTGGAATFTALSHNPKDMDFQNNMGEAAENVALVYGIPLPLVTMEAATFANMDAAQERLWTDTVLPLLDLLIQALSRFLLPLYGVTKGVSIELAYNADSVPALEPRRERLFKRMKDAVAGTLVTPDEARAEMGYPEKGGMADELLVLGTNRLLSEIASQPNPAAGLVKAMKACGYSDERISALLADNFGLKKAA